ncbi:TPA: hypothetical protein EYP66_22970 [Candidatus Poribacteria bacterium]|nr:hypothetical protein [Candidatus Poribacteria bacterium]
MEESECLINQFKFTLSEITRIFSDCHGAEIKWVDASNLFSEVPLYCPPYPDSGIPRVKAAVTRLNQSVRERKKRWSVVIDCDGPVAGRQGQVTDLPYLLIAVCHSGEPFKSAADIVVSFSKQGHSLHGACEALRGCAQWYVLSGERNLQAWEAPMEPEMLERQEADNLWTRFNGNGQWHVVHVLKLGVPAIRDE